MARALRNARLPYSIIFNSPDYHAKIVALECGIGLAALPSRMIPAPLVQAKEYYLPPLPPVRMVLCARPELETTKATQLLKGLSKLFFEPN
jgi:DNA-binding transcriptional LysR family regulator